MKRIYILRHAKSSWSNPGLRDHDRPLNKRGQRDAPRMAHYMKENNLIISGIYSSTSQRTRETIVPFIEAFSLASSVISYEQDLYHGYPMDYVHVIQALGENDNNILLVGHNPGITDIANQASQAYIENVPTCALLILDYPSNDWASFSFQSCKLIAMVTPKSL